jgi:hypothetical protein
VKSGAGIAEKRLVITVEKQVLNFNPNLGHFSGQKQKKMHRHRPTLVYEGLFVHCFCLFESSGSCFKEMKNMEGKIFPFVGINN